MPEHVGLIDYIEEFCIKVELSDMLCHLLFSLYWDEYRPMMDTSLPMATNRADK